MYITQTGKSTRTECRSIGFHEYQNKFTPKGKGNPGRPLNRLIDS